MNPTVIFAVVMACGFFTFSEARSLKLKQRLWPNYWALDDEPSLTVQKRSVKGPRCQPLPPSRRFIESMFVMADIDRDGFLDDHEYDNLFNEFDMDHDAELTLDEYVSHLVEVHHGQRAKAALLFRMGDFNGNQRLDLDDKKSVKDRLDLNHDGLIHECEFLFVWTQIADRAGI